MKTTFLIVGFYKDNDVVLLVIQASLVDILLGRSNLFFLRTRPNFRLGNTPCTVEWKLCIILISNPHPSSSFECKRMFWSTVSNIITCRRYFVYIFRSYLIIIQTNFVHILLVLGELCSDCVLSLFYICI